MPEECPPGLQTRATSPTQGSLKHLQGGSGRGAGRGEGGGAGLRRPGFRQPPQGTSRGQAAHPLCRHFLSLWAHPIHLNHICVPVLRFYSLWIQLQRKKERGRERERRQLRPSQSSPCCSATAQKLAKRSGRWNWGLMLILTSVLQGVPAPRPLLPWLVQDCPHSGKEVGCALRHIHPSPLIHSLPHPVRWVLSPHFTDAETEAHKPSATCSTS